MFKQRFFPTVSLLLVAPIAAAHEAGGLAHLHGELLLGALALVSAGLIVRARRSK